MVHLAPQGGAPRSSARLWIEKPHPSLTLSWALSCSHSGMRLGGPVGGKCIFPQRAVGHRDTAEEPHTLCFSSHWQVECLL